MPSQYVVLPLPGGPMTTCAKTIGAAQCADARSAGRRAAIDRDAIRAGVAPLLANVVATVAAVLRAMVALFGLPTDLLREVFVRLALDDVKVFRRVSRQARDLADAWKSQWREVNRHTVLSIKEAQRAAALFEELDDEPLEVEEGVDERDDHAWTSPQRAVRSATAGSSQQHAAGSSQQHAADARFAAAAAAACATVAAVSQPPQIAAAANREMGWRRAKSLQVLSADRRCATSRPIAPPPPVVEEPAVDMAGFWDDEPEEEEEEAPPPPPPLDRRSSSGGDRRSSAGAARAKARRGAGQAAGARQLLRRPRQRRARARNGVAGGGLLEAARSAARTRA